MEEKRLLSVNELAVYLAMPKATIYTYVSIRKIPPGCIVRIGRALKFDREAVDQWVSGLRQPQGPTGPRH